MDASSVSGESADGEQVVERAEFRSRKSCIGCGSDRLRTLLRGTFGQEPHLSMISRSPWGESPMPHIRNCEWVLVVCGDCGVAFHGQVLTEEWDVRRFSRWMTQEAIDVFENEQGMNTPQTTLNWARHDLERLLSIEKLTRGVRGQDAVRVLDFGCGWGRVVALAHLLGFEAYGVDRSTARLEKAHAPGRVFSTLQECREKVGPKLHAATLFEVLEHLFDPVAVLRALHAEIVPGGVLVVEVPNCAGVDRMDKKQILSLCDGLDHINAFTPESLRRIVTNAGFEPIHPPTAQVSADWIGVAKREVRRYLRRVRGNDTQQFFRRK